MNCKKISQNLSKYIDNELSFEQKRYIDEHIAACPACADELRLLTSANTFLSQIKPIEVSDHFNANLWNRIRNQAAERSSLLDIILQRLIPVPVVAAALIVVFSGFTLISPLLYATSGTFDKGKIVEAAKTTFAGFSAKNMLGPANFAEFCNRCKNMMCEYCKSGETCPMCTKRR